MKVRRVLIYEGPRDWIEDTISKSYVRLTKKINFECSITEESCELVYVFPLQKESIDNENSLHQQ